MSIDRYHRFEAFKVLAYKDKLDQLAKGELCTPVQWIVYPTNKCPYNCPHCIMKLERQNQASLPSETMAKIPVDAQRLGVKLVRFVGGGEPLMHPDIMQTIEECKKRGIKTSLDTNGYLLPQDCTDVDYLRISVDAGWPETYAKVHGVKPEAFKRLETNLKRVKCHELGLAFLITPTNYQEIYRFVEWASQFNPTFIHVRPAYLEPDYLEGKGKLLSLLPQIDKIKAAVLSDYPHVFFRTDKFDNVWKSRCYGQCRATPLKAVLTATGEFIICQDVFKRFGQYNSQTFEEAWFSEEHKQAIDSIDLDKCPRCVEGPTNEIIDHCILQDKLKFELI